MPTSLPLRVPAPGPSAAEVIWLLGIVVVGLLTIILLLVHRLFQVQQLLEQHNPHADLGADMTPAVYYQQPEPPTPAAWRYL